MGSGSRVDPVELVAGRGDQHRAVTEGDRNARRPSSAEAVRAVYTVRGRVDPSQRALELHDPDVSAADHETGRCPVDRDRPCRTIDTGDRVVVDVQNPDAAFSDRIGPRLLTDWNVLDDAVLRRVDRG